MDELVNASDTRYSARQTYVELLARICRVSKPLILWLPAVVQSDRVAVEGAWQKRCKVSRRSKVHKVHDITMAPNRLIEKALRETSASATASRVLIPPSVDVVFQVKQIPTFAIGDTAERACWVSGPGGAIRGIDTSTGGSAARSG